MTKASLFIREIEPGTVCPRGYGFAWAKYEHYSIVVMPIPLNVVAARLRAVWLWIKRGGVDLGRMEVAEAYGRAYMRGLEEAAGYIEQQG